MFFCEKLTALLALTITTGSELARAIHIDPSQISRMKTGAREQPRKPQLLRLMAEYFARHCNNEYRLSALAELTENFRIQADIAVPQLSDIIYNWLRVKDEAQPEARPKAGAEHFLYNVSQHAVKPSRGDDREAENWQPRTGDFAIYYGNEGKRQAATDFARLLFSAGKARHILSVSDECPDWISEDSKFESEIPRVLRSLTRAGYTFTNIAAPTSNIDDALIAMQRWLPAYVAGANREYYYPWMRDRLYRRTMFIAPGLGALYSESIGETTQSRMTTLTTVPEVVDAYAQKFADYLALCKPTLEIFTEETAPQLLHLIASIEDDGADKLFKFVSLPNHMLPNEILERNCKKEGTKMADQLYALHLLSVERTENTLKTHRVEDVVRLASPDAVRNGKVPIPYTLFFGKPRYYTVAEYIAHLQKVIDKMESTERYNVVISDETAEDSLVMSVKSNGLVMLTKPEGPFTLVNIIEPQLAAAFCEYLRLTVNVEHHKQNRLNTIKRLKDYAANLKTRGAS